MTDIIENAIEHYQSGEMVSLGGKLPYCMDLFTGRLLEVLLFYSNKSGTPAEVRALRKKANAWLFARCRPGFYGELVPQIHLRYLGQPGGHGKEHLWRLFFDRSVKGQIESLTLQNAQLIGDESSSQATQKPINGATREWGGLYLRSQAEVNIAEALDKAGVLFFANCRGRINDQGMTLAAKSQNGRVEVDFLVFVKGKATILEVDGTHHNKDGQALRDYVRDRLFLKEGIPTARFTAQECKSSPNEVVNEFLRIVKDSD